MKNSRVVAFDIIQSILKDNAYSNIAVENSLKDVCGKDKAFVSRIVYGVVERKITLEYAVDSYLNKKTKNKVRTLLLIGAYQILFMDKVPDAVAIYETVEIADELGISYYKKLINAVLRKISTDKSVILNCDDLEIKYSCPSNLINMWKKMYGEDNTISILECINDRPPVFAIPNTKFVDAEELQYELLNEGLDCELYYECVKINSSFDITALNSYKNGLFYIEDYSSYTAASKLNVKADDIVLDVCAAPGAKSFTMAQSGAVVNSFDIHKHRVELIKKSAERLDLTNIITDINDAELYNENIPKADKILCDVPCSGFGIIRRKPEIRYKNLDDIKELPKIQYQILLTSSKYLKTGGTIMYSTCTLNKKENEKVVNAFLEKNNNFKLEEQITIFPTIDGGDGFFYAIMTKTDD